MSTLKASPEWDLPALNTFIAQQENFLRGPLVGITGGDDGVAILEINDKAFAKPAANTILTDGRPPPGAVTIGNARILIRGTPAEVTAYRPGVLQDRA
jgi:hypothetical protein